MAFTRPVCLAAGNFSAYLLVLLTCRVGGCVFSCDYWMKLLPHDHFCCCSVVVCKVMGSTNATTVVPNIVMVVIVWL